MRLLSNWNCVLVKFDTKMLDLTAAAMPERFQRFHRHPSKDQGDGSIANQAAPSPYYAENFPLIERYGPRSFRKYAKFVRRCAEGN